MMRNPHPTRTCLLLTVLLLLAAALKGFCLPLPIPPLYPPGVYVRGTNLIWAVTNGPQNVPFYVVATTNLSLNLTNWPRVATNVFDQSGSFVLILPIEPEKPRRYYCVALPVE